jgi:hypothetical protein
MKPNKKHKISVDIDSSDEEMHNLDQVKKIRRLDEDSNEKHFNRISNESVKSLVSEEKTP